MTEQPDERPPQFTKTTEIYLKGGNKAGLAGFIISILGFMSCGFLSPVSLILSFIGLFKVPRGLAVAGVVISLIGFVPLTAVGLWWTGVLDFEIRGEMRAPIAMRKNAMMQSDLRALATALEAYFIDHNAYPVGRPAEETVHEQMRVGDEDDYRPPTWSMTQTGLPRLTTPVAYITHIPFDQFIDGVLPVQYYSDGKGWILICTGADRDYDIAAPEVYDSSSRQPTAELLVSGTYDPSNGAISGGDLWRIRQ